MTSTKHTPRQEMIVMARAFATAMGREFVVGDRHDAPVGAWYIERADTERALYRLAERVEHGAVHHPISHTALTSQGLADACCFAHLAIGIDREETRRVVQTIGAMRRADTEFITPDTVHDRTPDVARASVERVVSALQPCWTRA